MSASTVDSLFHTLTVIVRGRPVQCVEYRGEIFLAGGAQHMRRRAVLLSEATS